MQQDLIIYTHRGIYAWFISLLGSIAIIIAGTIGGASLKDNGDHIIIIFTVIGCIGVIFSTTAIVYSFLSKTTINNTAIIYSRGRKVIKELSLSYLKRIVLYKVKRLNGEIIRIVFDDGTFDMGKVQYNLSADAIVAETWISLEYSKKRLEKIKERLDLYPIEIVNKVFSE